MKAPGHMSVRPLSVDDVDSYLSLVCEVESQSGVDGDGHRRLGGGSLLIEASIAWALDQPAIEWIDLGVFSDNPGAQALYLRHGFQVLGTTPDRFRVDGCSLGETSMALNVHGPAISLRAQGNGGSLIP